MPSGDGTPRTYSIAADTASAAVNPTLLTNEIEANGSITTGLSYMTTNGDVLDIYFASALSGGEITALDSTVSAHAGTVTSSEPQRWVQQTSTTTSNQTWTNVLQRTADPLKVGVYRLTWNWELRIVATGPVNSQAEVRFSYDNGTQTFLGFNSTISEDYVGSSGWDFVAFAEGDTPVFQIEQQINPTVGGNDTSDCRRARIALEWIASV